MKLVQSVNLLTTKICTHSTQNRHTVH